MTYSVDSSASRRSSMKLATFCLNHGEDAIENAPTVRLPNGASCVPQHYLRYGHNRVSVEALVSKVEYDPRYPIFVSEDAGGIYVQIGIIGPDNYKAPGKNPKLVFGRRWRVEPNLPTSEILQTLFLALKKAREHEVRELFKVSYEGRLTTPLSNHHDLPLMARERDMLQSPLGMTSPHDIISKVIFDGGAFKVVDVETTRSGLTILDLVYIPTVDNDSAELLSQPITLALKSMTPSALLHGLMDEILSISDAHVDETFTFNGFARFSKTVDVFAIAQLSAALRQSPAKLTRPEKDKRAFANNYAQEKYDTDTSRIPVLHPGPYADKLRESLSQYEFANGVKV